MDYCNEKLKRLEMYDNANGSFLIDTLLNYYMCGFNVGKTAQMMYVHRNSLQYRLKKIEEILEISLDDSMEYLDVGRHQEELPQIAQRQTAHQRRF